MANSFLQAVHEVTHKFSQHPYSLDEIIITLSEDEDIQTV